MRKERSVSEIINMLNVSRFNMTPIENEVELKISAGSTCPDRFTGYSLDLSHIKLVVLDFDDTLCIHLHKGYVRPSDADWDALIKYNNDDTYIDRVPCGPNKPLRKFLNKYFNDTDKMMLTWASSDALIRARIKFIKKYYKTDHFIDYAYVPNRNDKIEYLRMLRFGMTLLPHEILVIEDHPSTLNEARDAGFMALSTAEITYMMWEEK